MIDYKAADTVAIKQLSPFRVIVGVIVEVLYQDCVISDVSVVFEDFQVVWFHRSDDTTDNMFEVGKDPYKSLVLSPDVSGWKKCSCCDKLMPTFKMDVGGWWNFTKDFVCGIGSGGNYCHNCSNDVFDARERNKV